MNRKEKKTMKGGGGGGTLGGNGDMQQKKGEQFHRGGVKGDVHGSGDSTRAPVKARSKGSRKRPHLAGN